MPQGPNVILDHLFASVHLRSHRNEDLERRSWGVETSRSRVCNNIPQITWEEPVEREDPARGEVFPGHFASFVVRR